MQKRITQHLHHDENVLCVEVPSWLKYTHYLIFAPLILPIIIAGMKKYTTHLVVTNKRVMMRYGIISDHSKAVGLSHLTTVKVHKSVRGKIFNYGYLHIHTQTGGQADISFHYLKNPIRVKKEIERGMALATKRPKH